MNIIVNSQKIKFPFEKYCLLNLSVVPAKDIIGIKEIRFVDHFSHPKYDKDSLGCYFPETNGKNAIIEIHIPNIIKHRVSKYYFERHPEISALIISETIFHEIGHHVHFFRKHGIKKRKYEFFADKYATAGYFHYIKYRQKKILSSYKWGSRNFIELNKEERSKLYKNYQEIVDWLDKHKDGIPFP